MKRDQLTKIEARLQYDQARDHKKKWQQVRTKIRRLKISRQDKRVLIADSKHCTGDLMDVLFYAPQFKDVDDYFDTINAYLRSENDCYDYKEIKLAYMPTNMEHLMKIITNQHRIIDRMERLREIIKG